MVKIFLPLNAAELAEVIAVFSKTRHTHCGIHTFSGLLTIAP